MTPEQIIEEWEKGCSIAGPSSMNPESSPSDCFECTEAMVKALRECLARQRSTREEIVRDFGQLAFWGAAFGMLLLGLSLGGDW